MPRETIRVPARPARVIDGPPGGEPMVLPVAELSWSREAEYVQLGVVHDDARENGLWADLDRPALNRLIMLLRRARDQAFGRDA